MHYVTYVTKRGHKKEEYLDIFYNKDDIKRYSYLLSLFEYRHIYDLYIEKCH